MYTIILDDFFSAQNWVLERFPNVSNALRANLLDINLKLQDFSADETIFPPSSCVMNSFSFFPINKTRVLIVGQDPYHGVGQANGLAFAVHRDIKKPPSLRNIEKELQRSYNTLKPLDSDLTAWAKQEVLLMNRVLTVSSGRAGSHRKIGWEQFTETIISLVSEASVHTVFILWGNDAAELESRIDTRHTILKSAHPSPLSAYRGFFGCDHFLLANEALKSHHQQEISWI